MQQRRTLDLFHQSYVSGSAVKCVVTSGPVKLLSKGNKKPSLNSSALNNAGFSASLLEPKETSPWRDRLLCLCGQPPTGPLAHGLGTLPSWSQVACHACLCSFLVPGNFSHHH
ncbi:ubiA prenyltransferase domain-containing protein 1 [Platysternon megacephalum]|uniref:UbiA prenyltransferase domain-containing protein 1 n=1 Tax=Platysternon megacephalum TaxID=55544 RepID=A0A4D9EZ55_9SAUR|nr:ubiA prenyltransferase domain-containing protein 1 [Platysternon megacephalum]